MNSCRLKSSLREILNACLKWLSLQWKRDPVTTIGAFISVFFILFLVSGIICMFLGNINESGYADNFDQIPGLPEERIVVESIPVEGKLFYCRVGYMSDYTLHIVGKTTPETISTLLESPEDLGFPAPSISYDDQWNLDTFFFNMKNIPEEISSRLKLQKYGQCFYSELEGYAVAFEMEYGKYFIKVNLLDKSGYFIIRVSHHTRH